MVRLASLLLLLLALSLASAAPAAARPCMSVKVKRNFGYYRAENLRARKVGCRKARKVARNFGRQLIGSSGSTVALGYSCSYVRPVRNKVYRVLCEKGAKEIRWRERLEAT